MSIDGPKNTSIARETTRATSVDPSPQAKPAAVGEDTKAKAPRVALDSVNTSDAAGDIDTAKVERIKAGLADGSLTFDAKRIAEGLIESTALLSQNESDV